jgi:hypothetical protein
MEYKIVEGNGGHGENDFENLERKVNDILTSGGTTVGGLVMRGTFPCQAVMQPNNYTYNNSNNNSSGGARKTRKRRS